MKTHLSDNLMLFRKHFNELYHHLRNVERDRDHYHIEESRNGLPTLQVIRDQKAYYLHSYYNPEREAEKWAEQLKDEVNKAKQVVIYGIGLGYHLESFMDKFPDKQIYLIEPDKEILLAAMEARNLGNILKNKNIAVFGFGTQLSSMIKFVQAFVEQVSQEHVIIFSPGYQRAYREEMKTFQTEVQTAILRVRGNMHTQLFFREEWPENVFRNMTKNVDSAPINRLENIANNVPVVVVGSGPSLDMDKDYLHKLADKALIFAAGSSVQALLSMGIVPDMIFSIDGSEKNYEAFKKFDYEEIPFVYCPFVQHQIVRNKRKNLFHVVMRNDRFSQYMLNKDATSTIFFPTTSVTGAVLQAAAYFGCNPVILVGQDLSFPGGKVYAGDVTHFTKDELKKQQESFNLTVENVQGGLNEISKPMLNTLRDMELCLESFLADRHVINTSKIGAKIKGTEHRTIEEVLDHVLTQRLDKSTYRRTIEQASEQRFDQSKEEIYKKMGHVHQALNPLKEEAKALLEELDELSKTKPHLLQKKIVEIDQKWLRIVKHETFEHVVSMCLEPQMATYKRYLPQITQETNMKVKADLIYKHMGMVLVAMVKTIPGLKDKLDAAMKLYYADHLEG